MAVIEKRINKLREVSDQLKHECGIALVHLKKPLNHYKEKLNLTVKYYFQLLMSLEMTI